MIDFKYEIKPTPGGVRVTFEGILPPELARQIAGQAVEMGAAAEDSIAAQFYLEVAQRLADAVARVPA